MALPFPFGILREDVRTAPSFVISEVPHRVKLDQNESPFDIPEKAKEAIVRSLASRRWNRYPQPAEYDEVKERFAATLGLDPQSLLLTAGCDQMILLSFLVAGGPNRCARLFEPTYPIFAAYGQTTGTKLDRVVLGPDYALGECHILDPVDLLILVSPNNPTGNGPDANLVTSALTQHRLVFVDEAYADYAVESVIELVPAHPNLLVGRSLSKSLLAGVRLGFGIGHPALVQVLERIIFAPYHLSAFQLLVAYHFDLIQPHLDEKVRLIIAERKRVGEELKRMGLTTWPSQGNFILFAVENASATYGGLLRQGVRIRDVSGMPGLAEHLRVTIGSRDENDIFLHALRGII